MSEQPFKFWMKCDIVKGGEAKDGKRWIQGIASTNARDLQGEIMEQNGIDTSYFLKSGYFNYDHRQGIENHVGQPTECKVTDQGLWVKGYIFKCKKVADDVWEHLNSLSESGATRRMGFSVEGRVIKKSGNVIEKCWLQNIAITPAPVNTTTWAEVAKSLAAAKYKPEVSKGLTFAETVQFIQQLEGLDERDATTLATLIHQSP